MSIDRGHGIATSSVLADSYDLDALIADTEAAKVAAQAAQTAAELALDNFDDRYLGAKTADPTVDNDGDALIDGAMYYDTTLNITKIYDLASTTWKRTTPTTTEQTKIDTVSGIASDVSTVAGNTTNINTVSGNTTNINTVATNDANVTTVAGISSDVTTVSGINANVTTVAGNTTNINTVAANNADITTVATNIADVSTVADDIVKVIAVADDLAEVVSEVVTVADDLNEATSEIDTVATNIANVNAVGTNIANVNSVAGNEVNINAVNTNSANINTVATNITNVNTVGSISADVTTVAGISADTTTVAGISANVTSVAGNATNINAVAADATDIGTVATNITNVNNVGSSITNIDEVANNLGSVNAFGEQYRVSATEPTTSLDAGDLWFDTTTSTMKVYTGAGFANAGSSVNGVENSVEHTATAGQTTFTATYDAGYLQVFLNGIRLDASDYTATDGANVVLDTGATVGDTVYIQSFGTFELADHYTKTASDARFLQPTGDGSQLTGIDALPTQTGYANKFLKTDGTNASWETAGAINNIFYENGQTVSADYTITSGNNAMSAGPITINTGVTVTVPTGSNWVIV